MTTINLSEIEKDPLGYWRRVEAGESFRIVRDGHTVAEIRSVPASPVQTRPYGLSAGAFTVPADFDAPLPEDVLEEFESR